MGRISRKPEWQKRLAEKRVERLFDIADDSFDKKPDESHRYVQLARKIAMRYNIKIKRKFCRKCDRYLKPGVNCRIRIKDGYTVVKCLECGTTRKYK